MTVLYPGAMNLGQMNAILEAKRNGTLPEYQSMTLESLTKSINEFLEGKQRKISPCVPDVKYEADRVIISGCGMYLNGSRKLFDEVLKTKMGIHELSNRAS